MARKKKSCERGQNCPYRHEYQHNLEFTHETNDKCESTKGKRKFLPFSGKGRLTCSSTSRARSRNEKPISERRTALLDKFTSGSKTTPSTVSAQKMMPRDKKIKPGGDKKVERRKRANHEPSVKSRPSSTKMEVVDLVESDGSDIEILSLKSIIDKTETKFSNRDAIHNVGEEDVVILDGDIREKFRKKSLSEPPKKRRKDGSTRGGSFATALEENPCSFLGTKSSQSFATGDVRNPFDQEARELSAALAESNHDVRKKQDREYLESLNLDREKELKKLERYEMEKVLAESMKTQKEEETVKSNEIGRCLKNLEEPSRSEEGIVTVAFQLPRRCAKARIIRRFHQTDPTSHLFLFLHNSEELCVVKKWTLQEVLCNKEIYNDGLKTIQDLGLGPRFVLVVKDEES